MRIVIHWYRDGSNLTNIEEFDTVQAAFTALKNANIHANVWPVGTKSGLYRWEPNTVESLHRFTQAMIDCR
jgi:hypothetical protein